MNSDATQNEQTVKIEHRDQTLYAVCLPEGPPIHTITGSEKVARHIADTISGAYVAEYFGAVTLEGDYRTPQRITVRANFSCISTADVNRALREIITECQNKSD